MKQPQLPPGYEFVKWDEANVKRFWDFVSQAQPDAYFTKGAGSYLVSHFNPQISQADNIVDFGCGAGFFLDHLCNTDKKIAGFDLSDASIRTVQEKFSDRPNFMGGLTREALGNFEGHFDLAFMLEVVEHLDDEPLKNALADVRSLLKPGARLIITTPNEENLSDNWICCPDTGRIFHRWQHVRSWSTHSLSQTLEGAGFEVEKAYACNVLALGLTPRALVYRFAYWLLNHGNRNLFVIARRR